MLLVRRLFLVCLLSFSLHTEHQRKNETKKAREGIFACVSLFVVAAVDLILVVFLKWGQSAPRNSPFW